MGSNDDPIIMGRIIGLVIFCGAIVFSIAIALYWRIVDDDGNFRLVQFKYSLDTRSVSSPLSYLSSKGHFGLKLI